MTIDVSVVLCTYNRCDLLAGAIASLLDQDTDDVAYEVLVVDNNSTDRTRELVESFVDGDHAPVRYLFEPQQGLSFARNAGIHAARGSIVAFTDDDVRVSRTWVRDVKRAFDVNPDVDCVGGKVLPRWHRTPPRWLTPRNWSPLALVDHGDAYFRTNLDRRVCLVGANLAVRRDAFDDVGLFAAEFQRVADNVGTTEDGEFQERLWRAGREGLYDPAVVVTADVQDERMTRAYHRRWHREHGRYIAMMRLGHWEKPGPRLSGVPLALYAWGLKSIVDLVRDGPRGPAERFELELKLWFLSGYAAQRRAEPKSGVPAVR